jgi:hypothetical protein
MTNPYSIDALAGQKYYVRSNDNSTIHELTASATGTLLIDFDGTNINSIGGVGAVKTTTTVQTITKKKQQQPVIMIG